MFQSMFSIFFNYIFLMIFMLISVAFFTIMERKLLGIFHIRIGPNKTGILGLFQPFYDAIKLFSKNLNFISKVNQLFWNISPILTFLSFLLVLNFLPMKFENNFIMMNLMTLMFILTIPTFFLFSSSFFSLNKFSIISSKRCISQMLSYEMGMMFILIFIIPMNMKMNCFEMIAFFNKNFSVSKIFMLILMFLIILSESSRIPFDFIESESELVSGFNIEYSSSYFSLFFIYEYGMMLFFSIFMSMMFFLNFISYFLIMVFILIRASFPRFRYDQMMIFFWKMNYPILISFLLFLK